MSSRLLVVTLKSALDTTLLGRTKTFSSDNPSIATVDQNGNVTGQSPGTTNIRIRSEGKELSVPVTVSSPGSVTITGATPYLKGYIAVGDAPAQLVGHIWSGPNGTGFELEGVNVTWSITSGAGFGSISASGVFTPTAEGDVVVRATAVPGVYGERTIVVGNAVVVKQDWMPTADYGTPLIHPAGWSPDVSMHGFSLKQEVYYQVSRNSRQIRKKGYFSRRLERFTSGAVNAGNGAVVIDGYAASPWYTTNTGSLSCARVTFPAYAQGVTEAQIASSPKWRGPYVLTGMSLNDSEKVEGAFRHHGAIMAKAPAADQAGKEVTVVFLRGDIFAGTDEVLGIINVILPAYSADPLLGWTPVLRTPTWLSSVSNYTWLVLAPGTSNRATNILLMGPNIIDSPNYGDEPGLPGVFSVHKEFGLYQGTLETNVFELNKPSFTGGGRHEITLINSPDYEASGEQMTEHYVAPDAYMSREDFPMMGGLGGAPSVPSFCTVRLHFEPSSTGYMPGDLDFRAEAVTHRPGMPAVAPVYLKRCHPAERGPNGESYYEAYLFLGNGLDATTNQWSIFVYNRSGVARVIRATRPAIVFNHYEESRDRGIIGWPISPRTGRESGPLMSRILDIRTVLQPDQGIWYQRFMMREDPYVTAQRMGAQGMHQNHCDAGPTGTADNSCNSTFEGDVVGGVVPLKLKWEMNHLGGHDPGMTADPNAGNYRGHGFSKLVTAAGQYPAFAHIDLLVRFFAWQTLDAYLMSPGLNGGVGAWYDSSGNLMPADPGQPGPYSGSRLAWTFMTGAGVQWPASKFPPMYVNGSDRDLALHRRGYMYREVLGMAWASRRSCEVIVHRRGDLPVYILP